MANGNKLEYTDSKLLNAISKPLLTKSIDWKYEEEVRCIFTTFSSTNELEMLDYDKYLFNLTVDEEKKLTFKFYGGHEITI